MMLAPQRPSRLLAAYALDLVVGDPQGMPHPVRLMGAAIAAGERRLLKPGSPASEWFAGAWLSAAVIAGSWAAARASIRLTGRTGEVSLGWTALATRSLLQESAIVLDAIESDDLPEARRRLSRIVGRDTESLDEPEILRAVVETVAEGLCDGVIAPLWYLALGGAPLAMAYKAVNTLDSMIGHPEPPYRHFGNATARLDDVANFVPARITALAIVAAAWLRSPSQPDGHRRLLSEPRPLGSDWPASARSSWLTWRRDGHLHSSPNAGQSEAAMAGALGIRLGGLNYYHGKLSPKPYLLPEGRPVTRADARESLRIAATASVVVFCAAWLWCWWRHR